MAATFPPIPTEKVEGAKYTDYLYNVLIDYGAWTGDNSIFNFDYAAGLNLPEQELADLIVMFYENYFFYELGLGTPAMFRHYLKVRWQQIAERYGKMFAAYSSKFPELYTTKSETSTDTRTGTASSVDSDTPKNKLDPLTDYASFKSIGDTTDTYTHTMSGFDQRTQTEMMTEYLEGIRDLKRDFINEFHSLFMLID